MLGRGAVVGIVGVVLSIVAAGGVSVAASVPEQPGAPVGVPAAVSGSVLVAWVPVADGVLPVTAYRVVAHPGGRGCTTGRAGRSCVVHGLAGQGPYTFQVIAVNAVGDSVASPHSVGVDPNEKSVGVRARLGAPVVAGRRALVTVRVPGGYSGLAVVRIDGRVSCRARVSRSVGSCVVVMPRRVGLVSMLTRFVGAGDDAGVRGAATVVVANSRAAAVSAVADCAGRVVVRGVSSGRGVVRVDAAAGRGWVAMRMVTPGRFGRFTVTLPAGTVKVRLVAGGFAGPPVDVERGCRQSRVGV